MTEALLLLWLAKATLVTTIVICLVLALRRWVAKRLGAQWAYALWVMPLLPFGLVMLGSDFSLPPPDFLTTPPAQQFETGQPLSFALPLDPLPASKRTVLATGVNWVKIGFIAWLIIAVLMLGRLILRHWLFCRKFIKATVAPSAELNSEIDLACRATRLKRRPQPILHAAIPSAAVAGLWRSLLLLPQNFTERYSPSERQLILRHEALHLIRRDLWSCALYELLRCVFWFNPIMHIAARYFRADQDFACDHQLMHSANGHLRRVYGAALVKTASFKTPMTACAINNANGIRERLTMLKIRNVSRGQRLSGIAALITATLFTVACSAAGNGLQQSERIEKKEEIVVSSPELQRVVISADKVRTSNMTSTGPVELREVVITRNVTEANETSEATQEKKRVYFVGKGNRLAFSTDDEDGDHIIRFSARELKNFGAWKAGRYTIEGQDLEFHDDQLTQACGALNEEGSRENKALVERCLTAARAAAERTKEVRLAALQSVLENLERDRKMMERNMVELEQHIRSLKTKLQEIRAAAETDTNK